MEAGELFFYSSYISNLEMGKEPEIKCQHLLDHGKSKRVPGKHLFLLY